MNAFGEFLCVLRKEKGLTQAALAELLGVSNKAVSKWETGEAMPETSFLLPIAEVFGVTVDELLSGKRVEKENSANLDKADYDGIKGHIFTRGKDDEKETLLDKICGVICGFVMLSGIVVYLSIGAFLNMWTPYWIILPTCALGCGIIGIIFNLCDSVKRNKKLSEGKNPYTDSICGLVILVCIFAYLFCGAFASLWHPCWIILIVGVAVDGVVGSIGKVVSSNKKQK